MLTRDEMNIMTPTGERRDPSYVTDEGFLMEDPVNRDYTETFDAALGRFFDEDLAISTFLAGKGAHGMGVVGEWAGRDRLEFAGNAYNDRNNALRQMKEDGEIPPEIWEAHTGAGGAFSDTRTVFWDQMSKWAQKQGRTDILTDKEVKSKVRDELRTRRLYSDNVDAKGNLAGSLMGQLTAAIADPPNIVAAVIIPSMAIKGVGVFGNVWRAAAYEMAVNTGVEALIQGQVYRFKQDIDAPYPWRNAIYNVLAATAAGSAFGGVGGGMGGLTKRGRRPAARPDPEVVTTSQVSTGIKEIQAKAYHGTTKEFTTLETKGLGAHVAVEPGSAGKYAFGNGRVYEVDVEKGNYLRVTDPGDSHRTAEAVIAQLVDDGALPKDWVDGLEVRLRDGLDDIENMKLDWLRGKVTDEEVLTAHSTGKINDDDLNYVMGDVEDMDDLPARFVQNNEKALRAAKRHFARQGYDGLVYEGATPGAGEGDMYVIFDSGKAKIQGELTPQGARAMAEAKADTKVYTDELDKSPEVPIKTHEENIQGAARELNDISPVRQFDEGEPLPDAEEIAAIDSAYQESGGATVIENMDGVRRTAAAEIEEMEEKSALLDKVIRCMSGG